MANNNNTATVFAKNFILFARRSFNELTKIYYPVQNLHNIGSRIFSVVDLKQRHFMKASIVYSAARFVFILF